MTGSVVDAFFIQIGIDPSQVDPGMAQVQNKMQSGLKNIMRNFVAPLASALAVKNIFGSYLQGADQLGKMAARLDVNAQSLQAWGEAAARTGGSVQGFQSTVMQLNRTVQEFAETGGGRGKNVFNALGLSQGEIRAARDGTDGVFDVFTKLAQKAETMNRATFTGFATQLGIDQGTISLLLEGEAGVAKLVQRQKELGLFTEKDMKAAKEFNNQLADLKQSFMSLGAVIMRFILPPLKFVAESLTNLFVMIRRNEARMVVFGTMIGGILTYTWIPAILGVVGGLGKLKTAITAAFSNPKAAAFAAALTTIYMVVQDFMVWMKGGNSALPGLWKKLFGSPEEAKKKIADAIESVKKGIAPLKNIFSKAVKWATLLITIAGAVVIIVKVLAGLKAALMGIVFVIKFIKMLLAANPYAIAAMAAVAAAVMIIKNWDKIKETFNAVKEGIIADWERLKNTFISAGDAIKDAWASVFNWFAEKFAWLTNGWENIKGKVASFFGGKKSDGESGGDTSLLAHSTSGSAEQSVRPSTVNNQRTINNDSQVNIASILVKTEAKDADGIAAGMSSAISKENNRRAFTSAGNSGVNQR